MKVILLPLLIASTIACPALGQDREKEKNAPWLIASGLLEVVSPNLGSGDNVFGIGFQVGFLYKNWGALLANHSTQADLSGNPPEEHRYDYALLGCYTQRTDHLLFMIGAGPSRIDYIFRGKTITPPTNEFRTNGVWEERHGIAYG